MLWAGTWVSVGAAVSRLAYFPEATGPLFNMGSMTVVLAGFVSQLRRPARLQVRGTLLMTAAALLGAQAAARLMPAGAHMSFL